MRLTELASDLEALRTDIADELRRRYVEFGEVNESILDFMDANRH